MTDRPTDRPSVSVADVAARRWSINTTVQPPRADTPVRVRARVIDRFVNVWHNNVNNGGGHRADFFSSINGTQWLRSLIMQLSRFRCRRRRRLCRSCHNILCKVYAVYCGIHSVWARFHWASALLAADAIRRRCQVNIGFRCRLGSRCSKLLLRFQEVSLSTVRSFDGTFVGCGSQITHNRVFNLCKSDDDGEDVEQKGFDRKQGSPVDEVGWRVLLLRTRWSHRRRYVPRTYRRRMIRCVGGAFILPFARVH